MQPLHVKIPEKVILFTVCHQQPLHQHDGTCNARGDWDKKSLQVTGVQRAAAEADGAAHHST